jgi:CRISPR system Cascade subunit CasD
MKGIVLLLDAPLQSWGTQSRFGHRDTDFEPSKSGVLGLLGSALGMARADQNTLARLRDLKMAVRVDREGSIMRDYHTAGGGTFRGRPHRVFGSSTVVTERFYLADACFVVALAGADPDLVEQLALAVQRPKWPLFLGRRSCTPGCPVFLAGPLEGDAFSLLKLQPWQAKWAGSRPEALRCVVEAESGKPRDDVPTSFEHYARSFATRFVREEWLKLNDLPGGPDASVASALEPSLT